MEKISFLSEGVTLSGHLFLPESYPSDAKLPAIVCGGSWLTVKEQMAGRYAQKLAEQGFAALAFDFRYFGESEGEPRQSQETKPTVFPMFMPFITYPTNLTTIHGLSWDTMSIISSD